MRFRHAVAIVVLIGAFAAPAQADIIVFDPNAYAIGTDVSEMLPGVSASVVTGLSFSTAVYSPLRVSTGGALLSGSLGLGGGAYNGEDLRWCLPDMLGSPGCHSGGGAFRLQDFRFDAPTTFVHMSAAAWTDGFGMFAYDAAGNLLSQCGFLHVAALGEPGCASVTPYSPFEGAHGLLTLSREQGDISRVIFAGLLGTAQLAGMSYSVPEPSTLATVLIGAVAVQLRRRKRPHLPDHGETLKRAL